MKKKVLWSIAAVVVLFLLIQLIPYGRQHTNPPVVQEPQWGSPESRQIAKAACFDCHSNETVWPWYSNIAPVSWLVQHDVEEGRSRLNFSEWGRGETDEINKVVTSGEMPPSQFTLIHANARLTDVQRQTLLDGLKAYFADHEFRTVMASRP